MRISKAILNAANTIISYVLTLSLCLAGVYALYALWDNSMIYASLDDVQESVLGLKPAADDEFPSFDELLAINPDVVGWVTIDHTTMDYPVVQGENNLTYINKDIYGDFSIGGSIFLDSRNDREFKDNYSLLYGHSINNGKMFGDIVYYQEQTYFEDHQTGVLVTEQMVYDLKIFASLLVPANEPEIFNPGLWQEDIGEIVSYAEDSALFVNDDTIEELKSMDNDFQILALSTCSYEFTDARVVVLAVMVPSSAE